MFINITKQINFIALYLILSSKMMLIIVILIMVKLATECLMQFNVEYLSSAAKSNTDYWYYH